jgi:hypothetical protein
LRPTFFRVLTLKASLSLESAAVDGRHEGEKGRLAVRACSNHPAEYGAGEESPGIAYGLEWLLCHHPDNTSPLPGPSRRADRGAGNENADG